MGSRIGAHNNRVERDNEVKEDVKECSCPKTKSKKAYKCPWQGKCLQEGWIYKCEGKDINTGKVKWEYIGCTQNNIKVRISEHYNSFKNPEKRQATKLSEVMWEEAEKGVETELKWTRLKRARARGPNGRTCKLCNMETMFLMDRPKHSINSREELGGYCPHRRRHVIENIFENRADLKLKRAEIKRKKRAKAMEEG